MAKHQAPDRHPVRDRTAVRTTALAMIGLAIFVLAMIASYSGAFAKPTLHHMTVAVAGPQQLVDGIRGQESLAVTQVGDGAAARQQVYERKSDAAFVASPTGQLQIYVAGGGGKQRRERCRDHRSRRRRQSQPGSHRRGRRPAVGR